MDTEALAREEPHEPPADTQDDEYQDFGYPPSEIDDEPFGVTDKGIIKLAQQIKTSSIKVKCDLSNSGVDNGNAKVLAEALRDTTVNVYLDLSHNKIGPQMLKELKDIVLQNKKIELDLSGQDSPDDENDCGTPSSRCSLFCNIVEYTAAVAVAVVVAAGIAITQGP